jgi:hypothetical protein
MKLERKIVEEACLKLWEEKHKEVEALGYTLSKDAMMTSSDDIQIIAAISPPYDNEARKKLRKIIPKYYVYKDQKIGVILSPSMNYYVEVLNAINVFAKTRNKQ